MDFIFMQTRRIERNTLFFISFYEKTIKVYFLWIFKNNFLNPIKSKGTVIALARTKTWGRSMLRPYKK